jgi:hypothetical protein
MSEAMKQAFGLVRRPWGVFYLKHKITGEQKSLKTNDKHEAQRILQAHNETECQPHFNLSLARVYLNGADPKLATRTWQDVMENIITKKTDETLKRWETAIKDKNFDFIRKLNVCEIRRDAGGQNGGAEHSEHQSGVFGSHPHIGSDYESLILFRVWFSDYSAMLIDARNREHAAELGQAWSRHWDRLDPRRVVTKL